MPTYSLYEIIKPKLNVKSQKEIEGRIRYNELTKRRKYEEEEL